jgi:hypothetical protein
MLMCVCGVLASHMLFTMLHTFRLANNRSCVFVHAILCCCICLVLLLDLVTAVADAATRFPLQLHALYGVFLYLASSRNRCHLTYTHLSLRHRFLNFEYRAHLLFTACCR